ncbi:MAG: phospholipase D-like domain-containing protein [bacterium]
MKKLSLIFPFFFLLSCSQPPQSSTHVYFSPPGELLERAVVDAIDEAHSQILVQAYGFTNDNICDALKRARRRHVRIKVLLDKSNETVVNSCIDEMEKLHIPTRIDAEGGIAHNKVMIIDSMTTITGNSTSQNMPSTMKKTLLS